MSKKTHPDLEVAAHAGTMKVLKKFHDGGLEDHAAEIRTVHASGDPTQIAKLRAVIQEEFESRSMKVLTEAR